MGGSGSYNSSRKITPVPEYTTRDKKNHLDGRAGTLVPTPSPCQVSCFLGPLLKSGMIQDISGVSYSYIRTCFQAYSCSQQHGTLLATTHDHSHTAALLFSAPSFAFVLRSLLCFCSTFYFCQREKRYQQTGALDGTPSKAFTGRSIRGQHRWEKRHYGN